MHHCTCTVH
uniref:Uncharacterized protein n=1 Tax=Arundo donax TaxID=35708 RepID=A0A0A9C3Z8_ARUDO